MAHLSNAKARLAQATAEEEQTRRKISMKEKEINDLKEKWTTMETEIHTGHQVVKKKRSEVEQLMKRREEMPWGEEKERGLVDRGTRLRQELKAKMEVRDHFL